MKIRIATADMFRRGFFRCHLCGDYDGAKLCPDCKDEIINFIKAFSDMKEHFLYGKCYWFACILRERFGGRLYYNPVDNHWACCIGIYLFDASGMIEAKGYEQWPGRFKEDPLHYGRLVKQCIKFTE